MLSEALSFWEAISGKVNQLIRKETKNTFRCERYEVTTAPNGTKIGVTLPFGTNEIFLPYSSELASATVGASVLVVWWGSMSNAKAYYFADGYRGGLAAYPVGSIYMSVNSVSPATLFGGTWEQLKDTFLLAAGDTYTAGDTGGEATHKLTSSELPSNMGTFTALKWGSTNTGTGIVSDDGGKHDRTASSGSNFGTGNYTLSGGNNAHNNMPPYLTIYMWKRTA